MSTNGRADSAGSDGFGGTGVAIQHPGGDDDPIIDDPSYSAGDEFEMDPDLVVPASTAPDQREQSDPWAGFDDETRELAKAKGWSSPSEMGKAYRNAESLIGSRDTEAEQRALRAEQQLQQLIQSVQAPRPDQQQDRPVTLEDIFEPVDYDELERVGEGDPKKMMAILYEQVVVPQMKRGLAVTAQEILGGVDRSVSSRIAPVEDFTARASIRDQAQDLAQKFPTAYARHQAELTSMLQRNPDLVRQPGGVRTAFNELLARDAMAEERARRSQEGETLLGGTRRSQGGAKPVDVDKMIRDEIEHAGGFVRDGLG